MRKCLVFQVSILLTIILNGCILSKSPNTDNVTMNLGEQKTFSVNVFPPIISYVWTLDGLSEDGQYNLNNLFKGKDWF